MLFNSIVCIILKFNKEIYIGNIEGTLTWGKCNFAASSSNINLSGSIICADCKDSKGNSHHSAIYLDNYISNIEGTLKVN